MSLELYKNLGFVNNYPHRELNPGRVPDLNSLDIHWVIPPFGKGAGGTTTILRFVRGFEQLGHRCHVWINKLPLHDVAVDIDYKKIVEEDFFHVESAFELLPKDLSSIVGDVVIATDRYTTYPVRAMARFSKRFYFVQDQEEFFYPVGTEFYLTQETYKFGFDCLCAGKWLESNMRNRFGAWAMSWDLSVERQIYRPETRKQKKNETFTIACYARHVTSRRCVELMLLGLDLLVMSGQSFHVEFFGWEMPRLDVGYSYRDNGVLSEEELAKLYRRSDLGMVFSGTNYSLIPKEMMACQLPVVELSTESINLEFPGEVIFKAEPSPAQIAAVIRTAMSDDALRESVAQRGYEFVQKDSWENSIRTAGDAILHRLRG